MTDNNNTTTFDVVVIGTGIGGSTFAYALAQRGFKIAVVDRGDFFKPDRPDLSPLHVYYVQQQPTIGGQTKSFGAAMYRLRESDFEAVEMESGVSPAWPISYWDLEPHYAEAEKIFRVHGSSANDATEPPRSTPWPHDPIPHQGPVQELVRRIGERAGIQASHIPRSIDYDPKNGGKCVLCRHCDGYYCPRDAKVDAEIGALQPALKTGNVTVFTKTECLRVLTTADGRKATGVQLRKDGKEFSLTAKIVCASGGLTETPLLLWRSRSSAHPNGLANGSGALGRHWAAHTQSWVFPIAFNVQKQPFHQKTFAINAFYHSTPDSKLPAGVIQSAGNIETTGMSRRHKYFAQALLHNSFQTFIMNEALPSRETGFALTDTEAKVLAEPIRNPNTMKKLRRHAIDIFKAAGYLVVAPTMEEKFHSVGTARMGNSPSDSVINSYCQAHDVEGLYVVDSAALPTAGALNSGLTIAAVALRAAASVSASSF
ncbi:MAG: GMC family oxidoreductase [Spongiibacteraceae bacterium]